MYRGSNLELDWKIAQADWKTLENDFAKLVAEASRTSDAVDTLLSVTNGTPMPDPRVKNYRDIWPEEFGEAEETVPAAEETPKTATIEAAQALIQPIVEAMKANDLDSLTVLIPQVQEGYNRVARRSVYFGGATALGAMTLVGLGLSGWAFPSQLASVGYWGCWALLGATGGAFGSALVNSVRYKESQKPQEVTLAITSRFGRPEGLEAVGMNTEELAALLLHTPHVTEALRKAIVAKEEQARMEAAQSEIARAALERMLANPHAGPVELAGALSVVRDEGQLSLAESPAAHRPKAVKA